MRIIFEKEYLEQLYKTGKTKSKKYRFPRGVAEKYKETIDKLRVADKEEDLYPFKSLNYEKLKGDKRGLASVRVNQKYRIEFRSHIEGQAPDVITICSIVELSNHYK